MCSGDKELCRTSISGNLISCLESNGDSEWKCHWDMGCGETVAAVSNHPVTRRGSLGDAGAQTTPAGIRQELNSTFGRKGWKLIIREFKNVTFMVLHRKGTVDETEAFHCKKSVLPDVKMEWKPFPHFLQSSLHDNISNFLLNCAWSMIMVSCIYMSS